MSDDGYPVPAATHRVETVIERSRFIATLAHAASAGEARDLIDAMRREFADATHNCWAWVAGPPGSTAAIGMSDAGEPHGTAGRPMLDVLLHSGVGEVAAVVTRYYGGAKLGKGGLARAYGGCVQQALDGMPRRLRIERRELRVEVGYADVDPVRRLADEFGAEVLDERFGVAVDFRLAVPVARADALVTALMNVTAGRVRVHPPDGDA